MAENSVRSAVPSPVKRQLRQEAGFGCCVCGNPILQYHHIVEWADENHNRPEDMMALCPLHHDQATKGAFPEIEQRQAKAQPCNVSNGLAKGLLAVRQSYPAIQLGSVIVVNEGDVLDIDGQVVLGMEIRDGAMLVSANLRSQSNVSLCVLDRNEWISGNPMAWDIEADWQKLTIRERAGSINLSINAQRIPASLTGTFWLNGQRFQISGNGIAMDKGSAPGVSIAELALVGISLRINNSSFSIDHNGGGAIVSWPDRRERLWKAAAAWKNISANRTGSDSG
ncbi:hypothetical protein EDC40_101350 [Aminobacter aminovorans]|uniref:HNH nuclease domain-containing protein n=1 Tax=Aminobacter aminovorans TaxID=83263 RepID=A0A380WRA8_AMIAI|nr:HNH endonuclease signature motif containing protein [Aminobacter aminovorans]TCS30033.1 hypothetical protein EDC40_101350 [Aminobacter aminovorans]SUU90882.1 Uncharacterised protein [Aminobacter aminovorans]